MDAVTRCQPIFESYGDPVLHLGPLGAGQEVKVLNNTVFAAQLALAAEVFDLAAARELDQQAVATVLASGSGRSYAAEVVTGMGFDLEGLAPLAGTLLAKDVGIFVDHTGLPETALVAAADTALARMGFARSALGRDDHDG
jgi:3-hydroxyisobutyrate dehydrogenase-like beta-hydroxyacid dehydrogenase